MLKWCSNYRFSCLSYSDLSTELKFPQIFYFIAAHFPLHSGQTLAVVI